jgi:fermentation-respiration switch protein FrsA (DUF1100 family)
MGFARDFRVCGTSIIRSGSRMKFVRNVMILLSGALIALYIAAVGYLYAYQRDMLFPRTTTKVSPAPTSIYRARDIREADGTRLTIWQASGLREGIGTFVMFYGNGASIYEFAQTGEDLHQYGFGVVLASYRGYSGNTGTPTEAGLMADARAILCTVARNGPIILWGHSLGSGVAAHMASEGRASALILESPFTAAVDVAAAKYPIFPVRWLMKDRFDTLSLVPQIRMPILILHGTHDQLIPYQMSETLASAFGARAVLVPIRGADHNPDQVNLLPVVLTWLHDHSEAIYRRNQ